MSTSQHASSSKSTLPGTTDIASSNTASVNPAKLAKNKRLPATMITPSGNVAQSKKRGGKEASKKKKKRSETGKEKALERSSKLEEKVKSREERKAKRMRAKKAWE